MFLCPQARQPITWPWIKQDEGAVVLNKCRHSASAYRLCLCEFQICFLFSAHFFSATFYPTLTMVVWLSICIVSIVLGQGSMIHRYSLHHSRTQTISELKVESFNSSLWWLFLIARLSQLASRLFFSRIRLSCFVNSTNSDSERKTCRRRVCSDHCCKRWRTDMRCIIQQAACLPPPSPVNTSHLIMNYSWASRLLTTLNLRRHRAL